MINLREIKNKIVTKNNLYCLCVISIIFFLDRYTKLYILNNFTENSYYLNNYMNFDLVWNTGIGFGLLQVESSFVYNLISFLIGIVILILIFVSLYSKKFEKVIFTLIAGGAFGNFYDRITYKAVPDFIDIHYGNFHWFTFNVADIFITFGIIIYLVKEALIKK